MYFLAKVAMKAAHMKVPNIAFALAMTRYTHDVNSYFFLRICEDEIASLFI
jgi:hypothetical protein